MVRLSQSDIESLKSKGYSELEIQQAMKELEQEELQGSNQLATQGRFVDPRSGSQMSSFASKSNEDIIRWQLELNDILERAEHILKNDVPTFKDGHVVWEKNKDPSTNCLNELGIQETLKILSMYINRNTILSDYTNDEINLKVFDFGRDLNNLYFMKSDEFGMDNEEKRKSYPMLVREIVDIVHSAYKRALLGGERRSLREMISVSQNTSSQMGIPGININNGMPQKERSFLNPMRYIRGKFVS